MKIAIPLANGKLSLHFGHCESFAFIEVNPATKTIISRTDVPAPPHQPGFLPHWMSEQGVDLVITGGMGQRALGLFAQMGIKVLVGAPVDYPENLVQAYLNSTLQLGANVCDH